MNERIRQLARQAKIDYDLRPEIARAPVWIGTDEELAKFARLIVAECALLCVSRPGPGDDIRSREHCSEQILQHFGVEE